MKITKKQLIRLIQEEFALVKAQDTPQNNPISPPNDPYFDYPDDEGSMIKQQLQQISDYSDEIVNLVGDNIEFEAWIQSKITKAADYISTVKHYLEYEMGTTDEENSSCGSNPYDLSGEKLHVYEEDET